MVEFSVGQQPSTYKALRFINCYYNTEKEKHSKKECAGVLPVPSEASPLCRRGRNAQTPLSIMFQ